MSGLGGADLSHGVPPPCSGGASVLLRGCLRLAYGVDAYVWLGGCLRRAWDAYVYMSKLTGWNKERREDEYGWRKKKKKRCSFRHTLG